MEEKAKEYMKVYRESHKEYFKEYFAKYREAHREEINQKQYERRLKTNPNAKRRPKKVCDFDCLNCKYDDCINDAPTPKEKMTEYMREYRKKHPEYVKRENERSRKKRSQSN